MTDNQLPILADGLFDGGLAADVAPKELRAAVNVLSAAGRPGSDAELATMAARVRQFSTEVNAAGKATAPQPETDSSSQSPVFVEARRATDQALLTAALMADPVTGTPMFATRVTRKALTIVAITLLAAGTVAAAAGGALPMFEDETAAVVENYNDSNAIKDVAQKSDSGQATVDKSPPARPAPAVVAVVADINPLIEVVVEVVDYHDECAVWVDGSAEEETSQSFAELQSAADAVEMTTDDYCAALLPTVTSDETAAEPEPEDDTPADAKANDPTPAEAKPTGDKPADVSPADDTNSGGGEGHGRTRSKGRNGRGNGNGHANSNAGATTENGNGRANGGTGNGGAGNANENDGNENDGNGNDRNGNDRNGDRGNGNRGDDRGNGNNGNGNHGKGKGKGKG